MVNEEKIPTETIEAQRAELNPVSQVYFRAGLIACREYMARFVEHESPTIAASIRANWWPRLGEDFGPPRKLEWTELTEGEYRTSAFRCKTREEVSPTLEALPIALAFLQGADESTKRCSCCGASNCGECGPHTDDTRTVIDDPCRLCGKCINHCPHQ